ncbi:MAG: hypothetical protein FD163_2069 [Hyphomonadaceae bacterium]|nr:MAG: hypothetical protein FD128_387 [Hyphomonadaceae bacterium]KAF0183875.1 MAG: hypothetical protein FD163_2069 [Hyphomonadaceae bacterium]
MSEVAIKSAWFDNRVTLAIILTFLIQAVAALMWLGAAAHRLDVIEVRVNQQAPIAERMARLEAQMVSATATLDRIEVRLDNQGFKP